MTTTSSTPSSTTSSTAKRSALILIPSGGDLPLAEPESPSSVSVGFFLVELAQVLARFEDTHDFTLVTPDGSAPQLDLNGFGLAYHAGAGLGAMMGRTRQAQAGADFDPEAYRREFADLAARRDSELAVLERHLGRLDVSQVLDGSEREVALLRPELEARLAALPARRYLSAPELVARHRDPADPLDVAQFDFLHAPGGHAPMISFRDDPWLGEILHLAEENGVWISLICHAPVVLTSTTARIGADGAPVAVEDNVFAGATVSTVPQAAERMSEEHGYLKVPGHTTRLIYYVDEALEAVGIHNLQKEDPSSVQVHASDGLRLLSTNGPQGVDALAEAIAAELTTVRGAA